MAFLNATADNMYLVRYYTAWIEDGTLYLVMEFCDYSLKNLMKKKEKEGELFSENEIRNLLWDVSNGLKLLHKQ